MPFRLRLLLVFFGVFVFGGTLIVLTLEGQFIPTYAVRGLLVSAVAVAVFGLVGVVMCGRVCFLARHRKKTPTRQEIVCKIYSGFYY